MTTYCEDCDNVHPETRKKEPWKWLCIKFPRKAGYQFVHRSYSPTPPYVSCSFINDLGECKDFTPIRKPGDG